MKAVFIVFLGVLFFGHADAQTRGCRSAEQARILQAHVDEVGEWLMDGCTTVVRGRGLAVKMDCADVSISPSGIISVPMRTSWRGAWSSATYWATGVLKLFPNGSREYVVAESSGGLVPMCANNLEARGIKVIR